jgi:FkbM family methyltransferase
MELIYSNHLGHYSIPEEIKKETCVDIGANAGCFTEIAQKIFTKVHSYEPNIILSQNLQNKNYPNVTVFNEAVGNEKKKNVKLLAHTNSDAGSCAIEQTIDSVIEIKNHWSDTLVNTVDMIDIETVIERMGGQIDYLKVDCENSEFLIFNEKNLSPISIIAIELHHHMGEKNWYMLKSHVDKTHLGFPDYPGYNSRNIECILTKRS